MQVELDVFSGRPNPRWQLDDQHAGQLDRLHEGLATTLTVPPEPPALGYRGFLYVNGLGRCRAYQGYVHTPRAVLADPAFAVERFLLAQLPDDLAPLGRRIASELARPQ